MPLEPATLYLYTKHEENGHYFTSSQDETWESLGEVPNVEIGKKRTPTLPKQARLDFVSFLLCASFDVLCSIMEDCCLLERDTL